MQSRGKRLNSILRNLASKLYSFARLLLDLAFTRKKSNALRLKIRFKNSAIIKPQEITYSKLDNIHICDNVFIHPNCIIRTLNDCHLYIREGTSIGSSCHIAGTQNNIIIGRDVLIADRVFISTTNYRYDDVTKPIKSQGYISKGDVIIGDGCWIGIGSCILSGAKIGKHSIIGANSVVTRNIPPFSVAAGNPAHVIKQYSFSEKKWLRVNKSR